MDCGVAHVVLAVSYHADQLEQEMQVLYYTLLYCTVLYCAVGGGRQTRDHDNILP